MLSRVGERMYWLGRQIERAENTARLVRVSTSLLLDLPPPARLDWDVLLNITGAEEAFAERNIEPSERAVVAF
jgi:uncharacterized alpha-E superfamily protein